MSWELQILGANSAVPTVSRFPSGQVIQIGPSLIMIDCGEGSQLRMLKYGVKKSRISVILISHLHGDHIFGLPGLLTSYNLYDREKPLHLIGPPGLREYVEHIEKFAGHDFRFPCQVTEISPVQREVIGEEECFKISAFPLQHRIPTLGFLISEKITRKYLSREKVETLGLSSAQILEILRGGEVAVGTETYSLRELERIRKPRSYGYVSDTLYFPECADYVRDATFLYHESTFLISDKELARERYHSTAAEAAAVARDAGADHLLLGHYSSRYTEVEKFRKEAETIFPSVFLALSGKKFSIHPDGEITENE